MKDTIIKGTGNSRYLKAAIPENITHAELVQMLRNGTFPIDLNGINEGGIEQLGTPLNTATLLKDETGAAFGVENGTVDEVLEKLSSSVLAKEIPVIDAPMYEYWQSGKLPTKSTSPTWHNIAYGNGVFVTTSNRGDIDYSYDGISWNAAEAVTTSGIYKVVFGGNKFVAVAGSEILYSYDGVLWSVVTSPTTVDTVAYGNGRFVALPTTSSTTYAYSDNGIDWITSEMPTNSTWINVLFGSGVFVAIYDKSSQVPYYSYDGITWASGTGSGVLRGHSTVANGMFFAFGGTAGQSDVYSYSVDGINWLKSTTRVTDPVAVVYDPQKEKYLLFCSQQGSTGGTEALYESATGTDGWSQVYSRGSRIADVRNAIIEDGKFIAVGRGIDSPDFVMTENTYKSQLDLTNTKDSSLLGDLVEALGNDGGVSKCVTGSYTGTGSSGSGNSNSLTFDFPPKLVALLGFIGTEGAYTPLLGGESNFSETYAAHQYVIDTSTLTVDYADYRGFMYRGNSYGDNYAKKSEDGKTIYWYHGAKSGGVALQLNTSGSKYYYIALG